MANIRGGGGGSAALLIGEGSYRCTQGNRWWGVTSRWLLDLLKQFLLQFLLVQEEDDGNFGVHFLGTWYDVMSTYIVTLQWHNYMGNRFEWGGGGQQHCLLGMGLTGVLRETDGEGRLLDLLLKQILLVQEEDDGRLREPLIVADGVKELHRLMHAVLQKGIDSKRSRNLVMKIIIKDQFTNIIIIFSSTLLLPLNSL